MLGDIHSGPPVVRIHSQCLTGDVFGSLRCDCRLQLELALRTIAQAGAGILLYEQQEGRGIGLMAKLRAYELQDQGLDTVEANLRLGFKPDCREFELPAEILKLLNVTSVRLITNNPEKVEALESVGIRVVERISAEVEPLDSFERYVQVKQEKMGHIVGPRCARITFAVVIACPTCRWVCSAAWISSPASVVGRPLRPILTGKSSGWRTIASKRRRVLSRLCFQFAKDGLAGSAVVHFAGQRC